jgi:hypothetical protein
MSEAARFAENKILIFGYALQKSIDGPDKISRLKEMM